MKTIEPPKAHSRGWRVFLFVPVGEALRWHMLRATRNEPVDLRGFQRWLRILVAKILAYIDKELKGYSLV